MISRTRPSFWSLYADLGETSRAAARRAYELFSKDPGHPSLHFKKLGGLENVWSVRVTRDIRAVAERQGDIVVWFWIGTHGEFDKLFS
ncbi:MAG: hypothetical protein ABI680_05215 [Chthoniobacteraceae bacterium]